MLSVWTRHGTTFAVVVALASPSEGHAQGISPDPNAMEVAALLRSKGHAGGALSVLTQARGSQLPQKMDDIADSLAAIAISFPGDDLRGASTRNAAVSTLLLAGVGETGIVGIERAVPYAGAADRLMRIAETARDVGIRGGALSGLPGLPNKTRLLPFLRQIATSQSPVAYVAVSLLGKETGDEGRAIARQLYREGIVTERLARDMLARLADARRW